jgi:hypothetical protein
MNLDLLSLIGLHVMNPGPHVLNPPTGAELISAIGPDFRHSFLAPTFLALRELRYTVINLAFLASC